MSYSIKINYLKNQLKYSEGLTEYQRNSILEQISELERLEQKQNLISLTNREYRTMINENNNPIDKEKCFFNSENNIKKSMDILEDKLKGKFGENTEEQLKENKKTIKNLKNDLKDLEKTIKKL